MKISLEVSVIDQSDERFTGPLGGWPFPLINLLLVDTSDSNSRIADTADLISEVNEASDDLSLENPNESGSEMLTQARTIELVSSDPTPLLEGFNGETQRIRVKADVMNSEKVYIGREEVKEGNGYPLGPGETETFRVNNKAQKLFAVTPDGTQTDPAKVYTFVTSLGDSAELVDPKIPI